MAGTVAGDEHTEEPSEGASAEAMQKHEDLHRVYAQARIYSAAKDVAVNPNFSQLPHVVRQGLRVQQLEKALADSKKHNRKLREAAKRALLEFRGLLNSTAATPWADNLVDVLYANEPEDKRILLKGSR